MATYDSYSDAIENAPIGSTISYSQAGGVSVDESTSDYELIGDQEPLGTSAESAALNQTNDTQESASFIAEQISSSGSDPVSTANPDPPDLPSPGEQIQDYYDGLESDPVNESQPDPNPPPAPAPDPTPDLDNTTNGPDAGGETNGGGTASDGGGGPAFLIAAAVIVAVVAQGVMN